MCNYNHDSNNSDASNVLFNLKTRQADGTNKVMSDALINSSPFMAVHISLLFSAILRDGVSPDNMLVAILIAIPKSTKKGLSDSTNYRVIAFCSPLSQLLDMLIRNKSEYIFVHQIPNLV